ncbi:hypothetical protein RYX36_030397, partial [Vicia faba]
INRRREHILACYRDICVGAIACRFEKNEGGPEFRLGVGTKLLNHIFNLCSKQNISEVYLYVQTNNEGAINFYK